MQVEVFVCEFKFPGRTFSSLFIISFKVSTFHYHLQYITFILSEKEFTYYTRDCENTTTPITGEINVNFGLGTAKGVAYNCMGDLCNSATMRQIPAFVPLIIALLTLVSPNVLS